MSFCPKCNSIRPEEAETECPLCGTLLAARRILQPGTIVNGFTIQSEIGRGGMGTVYLAKQANLGRNIALKVMDDSLTAEKGFVDGFFREVRAVAKLNHPNIVQAIDAGIANEDIYYFAMELLDGENLDQYLNTKGALPLDLGLAVAEKIASALAYATAKGLCHGDIKPENIILKQNGEIKLADLGLARDFHADNLKAGEICATPAYAPPEVIRSQIEKIDFKSDMYSFGVTMYHLLSGRKPFPGNSPEEICEKQLNEIAIPLHELNPQIPLYVSQLVEYMMEKDPSDRPETWQTVLDILHQTVPDKAENMAELEAKMSGRSFLLKYSVLILVFFILLLGIIVILWDNNKKPQIEEKAEEEEEEEDIYEEKPVAPKKPIRYMPAPKFEAAGEENEETEDTAESAKDTAGKPGKPKQPVNEWSRLKKKLTDKSLEESIELVDDYLRTAGVRADKEAKAVYDQLIEKRTQLRREQKKKDAEEKKLNQMREVYQSKLAGFKKHLAAVIEKMDKKAGLESDNIEEISRIDREITNLLRELQQVRSMEDNLKLQQTALPDGQETRLQDYQDLIKKRWREVESRPPVMHDITREELRKKEEEREKKLRADKIAQEDEEDLKGLNQKQLKKRLQKLQMFRRDLCKRGMFLWAERCDGQIKLIQSRLKKE